MDIKKQISILIKKLNETIDVSEKDDIEDQIIRLADILENKEYIEESINLDDTLIEKKIKKEEEINELDENDIKREQRLQIRVSKEQKYLDDNKLSSKDEEITRQDMMNVALDENEEYANKKKRNKSNKSRF